MLHKPMHHITVLESRKNMLGHLLASQYYLEEIRILWSIVLLICSQLKRYARVKAVTGRYTITRSAALSFAVSTKHLGILRVKHEH